MSSVELTNFSGPDDKICDIDAENKQPSDEKCDFINSGEDQMDRYNQIFVETVVTIKIDHLAENVKKTFLIGGDFQKLPLTSFLMLNSNGNFKATNSIKFFENKKVRYLWDSDTSTFSKLTGLDNDIPCSYFHQQSGLNEEEQLQRLTCCLIYTLKFLIYPFLFLFFRRILFGNNSIIVEVQSIVEILFNEVLGPFYMFQVFSIILWCFEDYIYYATCIVIMSVISLVTSVIQIRRNQKQLHDTVQDIDSVSVCRGGDVYEEIESTKLVPGDVILLPQCGNIMQCDAVLITGNAIVNESMLTGESVPITKTPLPYNCNYETYSSKEHSKHTLFCGTKVIQTRFYGGSRVKAVVIRTGFLTSKGELVRSIMFPKPVDFKFNRHIYKFIQCLAVLAAIGFTYTVILKTKRKVPASDILLKALDLITIVIPPALPAAMSIGVVYAQSRLRSSNIYCISPRSINISGCINCVCFDKTGTLTEDDLSFVEAVPIDTTSMNFDLPIRNPSTVAIGPLTTCLATCHSLTLIDGNIIGDPLDQKMFSATDWVLEEPEVSDANKFDLLFPTIVKPKHTNESENEEYQVGVLRQFTFSSHLQRMSVVTRVLNGPHFILYAKGSPEMISSLCIPETLPHNFSEVLMEYTQKGYRVLALGYRPLAHMSYVKVQKSSREELESNLTFIGLLVMGNMLKPETTHVIKCLSAANTRSVMVTGDNMLTALSVARDCSMIQTHDRVVLVEADVDDYEIPRISWKFSNSADRIFNCKEDFMSINVDDNVGDLHVAITGKTFRVLKDHYPKLLEKVAIKGTVFARMAPDQKQQLVELLQQLGYYVGMCGDGANDCGALKAAHAGVSLSEAEASVASPFTSKTANISCIPILIREGRASLVTAFGILKYMASYSLTQFLSVILLYTMYTNLTDMQFLYEDLFLISLFFVLFGKTEAYEQLTKHPPPSSLIGITPLSSMLLQFLLIAAFQVLSLVYLWSQKWYKPHPPGNIDDADLKCHDNYAIFSISAMQYITLAVVFSKGIPYRKPMYTNYPFLISILFTFAFTLYIIVYPHPWLAQKLELELTNVDLLFRVVIASMTILNFLFSLITESFIVDYLIFKKLRSTQWFRSMSRSYKPYKKILSECKNGTSWLPPCSQFSSTNNDYLSKEKENFNTKLAQPNGIISSPSESGISSPISLSSAQDNVENKTLRSPTDSPIRNSEIAAINADDNPHKLDSL
ncbi:cation-transporting ATPase 13A3-like protein [Dinothrombium tinctorium]|uniref:Cation-transporting ATPase 13A3-like protein n=1 Tax=Dinothrombium tinctorium TaxID=1965070 RepID=A0A3S3PDV8_9ACAR|nr:cation-transporting ATPase 13A3-like protein [Dinothrombium tinctorium]